MSSVINPDEPILLNRCGYHLSLNNPSDIGRIGGPIVARTINHNRGENHFSMSSAPQCLFPGNGEQVANYGLYEALRIRAQMNNEELHISSVFPFKTLPSPRAGNQKYPEIASFLYEHTQGMITYSKSIKESEILMDVHAAFPVNRIVVISNKRKKLSTLYHQLQSRINSIHLTDPQSPLEWAETSEIPRVLLAAPYDVTEYEFASTDIVIVLEASTCTQRQMRDALQQTDMRCRLYTLHPRRFSLAPTEADYVMAAFGPLQLDLSNDLKVGRTTQLVRIRNQIRYQLGSDQPDFAEKMYWQNRKRNNLICQIARQIYAGQHPDISPFIESQGRPSNTAKITILVDRPQHAIALANSLTDWTVLINQDVLPYCNDAFQSRIQNQSRSWHGEDKQIMLTEYAQNASIEESDILIWAAGTPYIDGIPKRFFRSTPNTLKPLTIIDFEDRGNRETKTFSCDRREQFFQLGIFHPGISVAGGRAALFLRNQSNGAYR